MMAAALAKGDTHIVNAAKEPEIVDLADLLRSMGANIDGDGSSDIHIQGQKELGGCRHRIIPDRIEAATWLIGAAATRGRVKIKGLVVEHLSNPLQLLQEAGCRLSLSKDSIEVDATANQCTPVSFETGYYPHFATDLQAPMLLFNVVTPGISSVRENVFENRFMHAQELVRMGAKILIRGNTAMIEGQPGLVAADVQGTDVRAAASLALAGLLAEGDTKIDNAYHLDRGYQDFALRMRTLGGEIERIPSNGNREKISCKD